MILHCRSCGHHDLNGVVSLGFTPLANALLTEEQLLKIEEKYPLDLVFCPKCSLVQIVETVPPEKLFSQYFYVSSISKTVIENAKDITGRMIEKMNLRPASLEEIGSYVLEIGSNDGYLLKNYVQKGITVIGVEPAKNLSEMANKNGIRTINGFFNEENAKKLSGETKQPESKNPGGWNFKVDVIHANNVLAHVADLHGAIEGIAVLLKADGVAVIETHYVRDFIEKTQFDCVYHEHLCYYSATSLANLFQLHGLTLVDAERIPIHGGSLRAFFQLTDGPQSYKNPKLEEFMNQERDWKVYELETYQKLGVEVLTLKDELVTLLRNIKADGKTTAIYGASAKSTTLLNFFGIDENLVEYVVDDTPGKQFHYTPGVRLPIYPASKLLETKPDYVLILTWNFAYEIIEKSKAYHSSGGKFIIPIPKIEVVE